HTETQQLGVARLLDRHRHRPMILGAAQTYLILFHFNDTPPPAIYTLSLHDALPIFLPESGGCVLRAIFEAVVTLLAEAEALLEEDRKSTRLNSSHDQISYAVFCLKKKTGSRSMQTLQGPGRHALSLPRRQASCSQDI